MYVGSFLAYNTPIVKKYLQDNIENRVISIYGSIQ